MAQYGPEDIDRALAWLDGVDELIGHNIIDYDLPVLEKLYGWTPNPKTKITDTVILSRLFRSDRNLPNLCPGNAAPHSLQAWGYRVGRGKPEHDDWSQFSPEMLHRCSEDVAINVLVYGALLQEQRDSGVNWDDAIETEHEIARTITQQELNGVPVDLNLVWTTRLDLVRRMHKINTAVVPLIPPVPLPKSKQGTWPTKQYKKDGTPTANALRYYGEDFGKTREYRTDLMVKTAPINLKSDKQVKEYLLSIGWVPTEWNFKKDKRGKPVRDPQGNKIRTSPRLKLDSLESCAWPEHHSEMGGKIVEYLMLAHREGMLRGWLRDVRPDGRISAQALPLGTPTGRMTHRKVVNVPGNGSPLGTELRSCFTSVPGYTRVGIDLASCQLRALCHYMDDEEYQRQVVEGDPHQYAADMAGLLERQDGKKMNYTVLFGGGEDMVSTSLGVSKVQAAQIIKQFFSNIPALDALQKKLKRQWKEKGYLVGLDGRAIWVRAEHMLLNYLLQTMEAVVMKNFINYQTEVCQPFEYEIVTTMHDEVQFLVLDEHVNSFNTMAQWSIDRVNEKFDLTCPQAIDIHMGHTWAECH
jgi:DNA polymerase I-like protein with 3'-5' exonuclease and polymerase domains